MKETILLSAKKPQYKANLHCHSTRSDGKKTPEELCALYKGNGYRILAITDHCNPKDHSALGSEDFLLLTGYEAYIRPSKSAVYDVFSPEIHLNLFAREPENEALICYNPAFVKYVPADRHASLVRVGSEEPREYTVEYINRFIRTAREAGYLVAYNHPVWSMEDEERVMAYEGIFSLELFNTSSRMINRMESGEALYDKMLRRGMPVFCHAADDNHNGPHGNDSCGYFTMISAEELSYPAVIRAMEAGDMYASNGPRIEKIALCEDEDGKRWVHVETSPAAEVYLHVGSKAPAFKKEEGTSFDLPLHPNASYFRVAVYDKEGKVANSRGYYVK